MKRITTRLLAPLALAGTVALGLAACAPAAETPSISIPSGTVVIDVRTPAEYAAGHLKGAINIDVESPSFNTLASQLPADGNYVLYCHSGSRAAAAISRMATLGFIHLTNAGGLDAASTATGLGIVR
ncbi:rhodanese-like domain-containing protein [Lysinimonas soli]|uniref:Rhodanese-like domain-containing protein n=1 Tax=Lysinimonas soli TaxID=1074233 RepID=A0ABW0NSF3_9MICO